MLTVSKVLILRATAMKENIVRLTQSSPAAVHVRWPALPPYCVFQEEGFLLGGEREGQLVETRGADGSVQHHGQLARLRSLLSGASHTVTLGAEVGEAAGGHGARLQPGSEVFLMELH